MRVLPEEVHSFLTSFDYRNFKIISTVLLSSVPFCHVRGPRLTGWICLFTMFGPLHKPKGCQQSPCHLVQPGQVALFSHRLPHVLFPLPDWHAAFRVWLGCPLQEDVSEAPPAPAPSLEGQTPTFTLPLTPGHIYRGISHRAVVTDSEICSISSRLSSRRTGTTACASPAQKCTEPRARKAKPVNTQNTFCVLSLSLSLSLDNSHPALRSPCEAAVCYHITWDFVVLVANGL